MSSNISKNDTRSCFSVLSCFCCLRRSKNTLQVDMKVAATAAPILRENMMVNPLREKLLGDSKKISSFGSGEFVRRNCEPYAESSN